MIASHFGFHTDLVELRRKFSVSLKGATLAQLMRHASALQLNSRPLRLELNEIDQLALPCILHWNLNHFVVLKAVRKDWHGKVTLVLLDPAVGERRVSLEEASSHFTGVALELTPSPSFKPKDEKKQVALRDLTGHIVGLRPAIVKVLALALALEIFAICSPLFNQFVIDEVIVSGDKELLVVMVFGFALLIITQNAIGLARSWFLMRWSMDISLQWSARVFAHLVRLPVSYFEKRHLGDVVSRFGSIGAIQSTLTSMFVESVL
ncbi:MAG: cysteine peptidase family C39 domain-containing protein, partial [Undibacterium umbellatum]|uniref:cysteine peptidase family C39 domain-containing protein n=1 Tax=Undibacterium umbellatum TaxID=2762300 RepID=UPI003BB7CF1A